VPMFGECEFDGKGATARYCLNPRSKHLVRGIRHDMKLSVRTISVTFVNWTPIHAPSRCTWIENVGSALRKKFGWRSVNGCETKA